MAENSSDKTSARGVNCSAPLTWCIRAVNTRRTQVKDISGFEPSKWLLTKGRMMDADAVCKVWDTDWKWCKQFDCYLVANVRTLQANMNDHAQASSTPSNPSTISLTNPSLCIVLTLLSSDPHTSAIALCVSDSHFGSAARMKFHVSCSRASEDEVTRRYLKRDENVARSAVSAGAESER